MTVQLADRVGQQRRCLDLVLGHGLEVLAIPVATQEDRADGFERYVTILMKLPFVVGYHWHKYADEPPEGCRTGENFNFGLVNNHDEPWEILMTRMAEVNARVEALHVALSKP